MTKLILSTSNLIGGGPTITRRPSFEKSNTEFTNSLRANFEACQQAAAEAPPQRNGDHKSALPTWVEQDRDTLYVPSPAFASTGLAEERSQYDITAKLFFLPSTTLARRGAHARDAVERVLRELRAPSLDLLILSFPGVTFDADDDDADDDADASNEDPCPSSGEAQALDEMLPPWRALEELYAQGVVGQLGLAEFSSERLEKFLPHAAVRPSVDQINVRDCCVVPKSLILYGRAAKIELLTHNDCTNILPKGTIRELLGSGLKGAGLLAIDGKAGLEGDIEPQWVIKYTAVVRDRGVIENKGYFAMAEISD